MKYTVRRQKRILLAAIASTGLLVSLNTHAGSAVTEEDFDEVQQEVNFKPVKHTKAVRVKRNPLSDSHIEFDDEEKPVEDIRSLILKSTLSTAKNATLGNKDGIKADLYRPSLLGQRDPNYSLAVQINFYVQAPPAQVSGTALLQSEEYGNLLLRLPWDQIPSHLTASLAISESSPEADFKQASNTYLLRYPTNYIIPVLVKPSEISSLDSSPLPGLAFGQSKDWKGVDRLFEKSRVSTVGGKKVPSGKKSVFAKETKSKLDIAPSPPLESIVPRHWEAPTVPTPNISPDQENESAAISLTFRDQNVLGIPIFRHEEFSDTRDQLQSSNYIRPDQLHVDSPVADPATAVGSNPVSLISTTPQNLPSYRLAIPNGEKHQERVTEEVATLHIPPNHRSDRHQTQMVSADSTVGEVRTVRAPGNAQEQYVPLIHTPLGMISDAAIRDIDRRILRRLTHQLKTAKTLTSGAANSKPVSLTSGELDSTFNAENAALFVSGSEISMSDLTDYNEDVASTSEEVETVAVIGTSQWLAQFPGVLGDDTRLSMFNNSMVAEMNTNNLISMAREDFSDLSAGLDNSDSSDAPQSPASGETGASALADLPDPNSSSGGSGGGSGPKLRYTITLPEYRKPTRPTRNSQITLSAAGFAPSPKYRTSNGASTRLKENTAATFSTYSIRLGNNRVSPALARAGASIDNSIQSSASAATVAVQSSVAVQSLSVKPAAAIRTFPVSVVSSVVGIASYVVADILPSGTGFSKVQAMNGGYSGGFFNDGVGASHATVWTTIASASAVDMTPSGLPFLSAATTINSSITGVRKIGGTSLATGNASNGIADHAVVWYNANPASAADINPTGYTASFASGITVDGADLRIVGTAIIGAISHALVWNGVGNTINANTYTDLHSASLTASAALAADGNVQVGNGSVNFGGINALAWNGTAASLTNLQPDPTLYGDSSAVTVVGTRAGGFATTNTTWGSSLLNNKKHAVIWTNLNAGSYVDLQPGTGYTRSYITGINANFEVGAGLNTADNNLHALLWNFNGTQFVDLNTFLPSGFTYKNVEALGIDTNNTVYGYAMDSAGVSHPVVWNVAVPEPTAAAPIALYGIILLRKKRRKNDPA